MFISEILDNPIRKSGCYADDVVTGISGMDKAYLATTWFIRPKDGRLRRVLDHFQGRDAEALLPLFERKMRGYKSLLSDDKPEPMWLLHDTMLLHLLTGNGGKAYVYACKISNRMYEWCTCVRCDANTVQDHEFVIRVVTTIFKNNVPFNIADELDRAYHKLDTEYHNSINQSLKFGDGPVIYKNLCQNTLFPLTLLKMAPEGHKRYYDDIANNIANLLTQKTLERAASRHYDGEPSDYELLFLDFAAMATCSGSCMPMINEIRKFHAGLPNTICPANQAERAAFVKKQKKISVIVTIVTLLVAAAIIIIPLLLAA